jgi:hypothetical protein
MERIMYQLVGGVKVHPHVQAGPFLLVDWGTDMCKWQVGGVWHHSWKGLSMWV